LPYPTCRNVLLNPLSPSIVSRIDAPELADDERCRGFGIGTSSKPFEREELRLREAKATFRGLNDVADDERDMGEVSEEEVEVLDVVVARGEEVCLLYAERGIKLLS
jgi:hypothetical protein